MRISTFSLAALFLTGGAAVASDDLTIVSKHTLNGKPTGITTSYLSADHVRMAREVGQETIVDLKTSVMTTLDGKKKTYFTVTKQDMEELGAKMKERMNTPEMKKAMEMMGSMAAGMEMDVKRTGTTRKIAGYGCQEWAITMGGMSTIKECVSTELEYPAHAFDAYKQFSEGMKNMMGAFGPMAKAGAEFAEKMKNVKGFPVATSSVVDVMGNKTTTDTEVIEVRRGSIPASVWEIPAGYTKVENPMLKSLESGGRRRPHARS